MRGKDNDLSADEQELQDILEIEKKYQVEVGKALALDSVTSILDDFNLFTFPEANKLDVSVDLVLNV